MQNNRVTTKDIELHLKKRFIHQSTSGRGCQQTRYLPKLLLTLFLSSTFLSSIAIVLRLATILTWGDGIDGNDLHRAPHLLL